MDPPGDVESKAAQLEKHPDYRAVDKVIERAVVVFEYCAATGRVGREVF